MQSHHKYLCVVTAISVAAVVTMASLRNQDNQASRNSSNDRQIQKPDEDEWPIAAYENPEPVDERQRALREARGKRYDKSFFGVKGTVKSTHENIMVVLTEDWEEGIPPLPVSLSSAIVIGTVLDAKGFVSADQTGVYSEFPTRVDEVLKTDGAAPPDSGSVITVQRSGGRVQGASARILFRISGQRMPRQGRQYVMFLQRQDAGQDYKLITGYELHEGKVYPLDNLNKFASYAGRDKATFIQALRDAIMQP